MTDDEPPALLTFGPDPRVGLYIPGRLQARLLRRSCCLLAECGTSCYLLDCG